MAQRAISSVFGKLATLVVIAVAFFGALVGTIYLSLRSPEVKVPEIVGKSSSEAETILADAGLNVRTRARRFSAEVNPDTVLDQTPRPGELVKAGQTVAVVLSRAEAKEGESSVGVSREPEKNANEGGQSNANGNAGDENRNENQNRPKRTANKNKNANANNQNQNADATENATANSNLNTNLVTNGNSEGTRNTAEPAPTASREPAPRNSNTEPPRTPDPPAGRNSNTPPATTRPRAVENRNSNAGRTGPANRNTNRRPPGV